MLAILVLWFLISVPLTVVGGVLALRRGPIALPARVNAIPRQIPPQPTFLKPWPRAAIAGILPFGAACVLSRPLIRAQWLCSFIELYFVLHSLFANRTYYVAFGAPSVGCPVALMTQAFSRSPSASLC